VNLDDLPDEDDHCLGCGAELPRDSYYGIRRYCSYVCRKRAYRRPRVRPACAHCGGTIPFWKMSNAIYCTRQCAYVDHYQLRNRGDAEDRLKAKAGRTCEHCGGAIAPERRKGTRYCSRACGEKARRSRP
jgi:predicted nucleic acid-binding Zn ribbon protein